MKTKWIAVSLLLILILNAPAVLAFARKPKNTMPASAATEKKYTCPMFCTVSTKPGKCPKCGMEMGELTY